MRRSSSASVRARASSSPSSQSISSVIVSGRTAVTDGHDGQREVVRRALARDVVVGCAGQPVAQLVGFAIDIGDQGLQPLAASRAPRG